MKKLTTLLLFAAASLPLQANPITLKNGDTLNGVILEQTDSYIRLEHPSLGIVTIPAEQVKSEPVADTASEDLELEPDDLGLLNTGFLTGWNRSLGLGLSGAEGNSDNNQLHVDLSFDYEDDEERNKFRLDYDLKSEDGERTENDLVVQFESDYLMPDSPWFWFHRERFELDKFEDWDYRIGGFIGPGYDFINTDTLQTSGRLGIGGTHTTGGDDDGFDPELLIGAETHWTISKNQSLSLSNTLFPNLDETGEFRNISRIDWKLKLSELYKGISLKAGIVNEYESVTPEDSKHNDLKYNLSLDVAL